MLKLSRLEPRLEDLYEMGGYNSGIGIFELAHPNDGLRKQLELYGKHADANSGKIPAPPKPTEKPSLLYGVGPAEYFRLQHKGRVIPKLPFWDKYLDDKDLELAPER